MTTCNFCGKDHFIRDCDIVKDYIRAGKAKRNIDGKVVLPSGAFAPRSLPGNLLKDKFDEWHKRNPGQLGNGVISNNATMMFNIAPDNTSYSLLNEPLNTIQLSVEDRIAHHKAQIFNLENQRKGFKPIIKTRAQRQQEANESNDDTMDNEQPTLPVPATSATHDPLPQPQTSNARLTPPFAPVVPLEPEPEHPYQAAKDAAYAPPCNCNIAAPTDRPNNACKEAAYHTLPPIHNTNIATDVYKQSLDTQFYITQRELLSLTPEVRSQYRDATTVKRQPNKENFPALTNFFSQALPRAPVAQIFQFVEQYDPEDEYYRNLDYSHFINAQSKINGQPPPKGAQIVNNEFNIYYRNLRPGDRPDPNMLTVTLKSTAIRSIFTLIDDTLRMECVLDPGSTIVAMSEYQCTELGLAYDPTVVLNMQSANGAIDPSLGLARNVPFSIGELTVYLQVHIIRNPPYDILLG